MSHLDRPGEDSGGGPDRLLEIEAVTCVGEDQARRTGSRGDLAGLRRCQVTLGERRPGGEGRLEHQQLSSLGERGELIARAGVGPEHEPAATGRLDGDGPGIDEVGNELEVELQPVDPESGSRVVLARLEGLLDQQWVVEGTADRAEDRESPGGSSSLGRGPSNGGP